jgi:hypothetical protein
MTEAEQRMADRLRREATAIMDTHPGASAAMQLAADFLDQCAEAKPVAWRVECRWKDRSRGGDWRKYADYGTEQAATSSQQVFANPGDIESRIVPLYAAPVPQPEPSETQIEDALRRAFQLGQTYWSQADSESWSENKKSDKTLERFRALVAEFAAKEQK